MKSLFFLLLTAMVLPGQIVISEFLADNDGGIRDEDGDREDWVELFNSGSTAVEMEGWWLTDDDGSPSKWTFPAATLEPGGTMLVWASGKNRSVAGQPLHSNFKLSRGGEYLGLFQPAASNGLPEVVQEFSPEYPKQVSDVSYGRGMEVTTTTLLTQGSPGRYRIPSSANQYSGTNFGAGQFGHGNANGWNRSASFDDSAWASCAAGIGYDTMGRLNGLVGTDILSQMRNVNTSVLLRMKFEVSDPSLFTSLTLRMKFEDGAVAFFNGDANPVAEHRAPSSLAYNSVATSWANRNDWEQWSETALDVSDLVAGENLLAIQGLNRTSGSSDFLALPEIVGTAFQDSGEYGYLDTPSPGSLLQEVTPGALISEVSPQDPDVPRPTGQSSSPPLTVSATVVETGSVISQVRAIARIGYAGELAPVVMKDDGVAPDAESGDDVYTALLPTNMISHGQMFRWRFEVQDAEGNLSKWPAFRDPLDSPEYLGTVAERTDEADTLLQVMDWFVAGAPADGPVNEPFRGSMLYRGYFYDNIGHKIHGQSSRTFAKKSYDFDSNDGFRFDWKDGERKVKDLNLLSNYADKTKTRNSFCHEIGRWMGTPDHFCEPVRVHLNGAFHGVMDLMEDGDDRMLERNGFDPEGSLYKVYDSVPTVNVEKKTRQEEGNSDLEFFSSQLDENRSLANRRTYAYDYLDIPAAVNYLVTRQVNSDMDHGHKNYYLYHDLNRSGLWRPMVWDVDLSHGHKWNGDNGQGGYFNDAMVSDIRLRGNISNNRLYNLLYETPEFQQMITRRLRSAMDEILGAPGEANSPYQVRMRQLAALVDPNPANPSPLTDGDRDHARWGNPPDFLDNRPREEVERVISDFLVPRRSFLFDQSSNRPLMQRQGLSGGTPIPNSPQIAGSQSVTFDSVDYLPSEGTQEAEYVILRNNLATAVDISGWTLDGGIEHTFQGGVVIPAGNGTTAAEYRGLLHVAKNVFGFRSRSSGPRAGQKRFLQGNYKGQLSARGETVSLRDADGQLISSFSYGANPTVAQVGLRISELQYHPVDPTAAESVALLGVNESDFEYLELMNVGGAVLALEDCYFGEGIEFEFPNVSLAVGERIILARNPAAFSVRYPTATANVVGPYLGELSNSGERLQLLDPVGEVVLDFEYKDGWYPASDGDGRSLVVRDVESLSYDQFDSPQSWGMGLAEQGSPGAGDASLAQAYYGWDNFHFTSEERDDALISGPDADPDGDGRNNFSEYAFGTNPRVADRIDASLVWWEDEMAETHPAAIVARPENTIDVNYELVAGDDLESWDVVATDSVTAVSLGGGLENATYPDVSADGDEKRFFRVRATPLPED
ncbi:MAG: CotH kinase family protein [Roseibacillus sp.]